MKHKLPTGAELHLTEALLGVTGAQQGMTEALLDWTGAQLDLTEVLLDVTRAQKGMTGTNIYVTKTTLCYRNQHKCDIKQVTGINLNVLGTKQFIENIHNCLHKVDKSCGYCFKADLPNTYGCNERGSHITFSIVYMFTQRSYNCMCQLGEYLYLYPHLRPSCHSCHVVLLN